MSQPIRFTFFPSFLLGAVFCTAMTATGLSASTVVAQETSAPEPTASPNPIPSPNPPGTLDLGTSGEAPAPASSPSADPQVLVAEVLVNGTDNEDLVKRVYAAIQTKAGQTTSRGMLQADINAVFATGFFADVKAVPTDTPLGVRVTFDVKPNPVLQSVQAQGSKVLPQEELDRIFAEQKGQVLNFSELQRNVQAVEKWYADKGFVLAKITDVKSSDSGIVTLQVAEGEIEDIQVKGNTSTRDFIITRQLQSKPGEIFNRDRIQTDLQGVFNLNLFQDVTPSLDPGKDPSKVILVINVEEKRTGSINASAGVSSSTGVFGSVGLSEQNLGGNNQDLGFNVQVGTNETLFDLSFTDPWIATESVPTSFNVNAFNRRTSNFVFDGDFQLPNGDPVRTNRLGASVTFSRPLDNNWRGSLGAQIQFVDIRDNDNRTYVYDQLGNPITFNSSGQDNYTTLRLGLVRDTRDNPLAPTKGSILRFSSEQSLRLLQNGLTANKIEVSYSQFMPVSILRQGEKNQEVLAFDIRGGTVLGDLAPYDAFTLGGGNTVRGFFEGELSTGRSYALATAEYRFPLFNPVGGVVFADYGSDLNSASAVVGNPGDLRGKPGSGLGLGAGIRVQSPLGALRVDYGIRGLGGNNQGQITFSIGEKF